jgi:hypothetical protein
MKIVSDSQRELYKKEGYMILPGVIPPAMIEMLREECSYYLGYCDSIMDSKGVQTEGISHRGTCTETPEKTYALADAYQRQTGELLPLSWDFSHFAVVKHLVPENIVKRLLVRPDLIQRAR